MPTQQILTRTLVELADTLVDDFDVVELLSVLTDRCCEAFDIHDAGLMLAAPVGSELRVLASSSVAMHDLELYEVQASEGPCFDCYRTGDPVLNVELAETGQRWPSFTPAALEAGYRSVSAIPMRLRGTIIGALNLFRVHPGALGPDDVAAAQAFADVATIAVLQHQATTDARALNEQLNHALNSRVVIEQAKGMLAERAGTGVQEAFGRLRRHARNHNVRLADLAADFLSGTVPLDSLDP